MFVKGLVQLIKGVGFPPPTQASKGQGGNLRLVASDNVPSKEWRLKRKMSQVEV